VKDTDHIARLQQHLTTYKNRVLLLQESGPWGRPPRLYPHILPTERRELNIVTPLRELFWRAQSQRGWRLHRYFHHLSSSQALAFNLLFLLYPEVPSRMVFTRRLLGLPEGERCHLDFEVVLNAGEGTNIDALICAPEGTRTIVEIKLTSEASAQRVRMKGISRSSPISTGLSWPGALLGSCLEPLAFFRDYQLYRNLAQIRRDSRVAFCFCYRGLARSCGTMPSPGANRRHWVLFKPVSKS
jgi:hypothetical protein